MPSFEKSPPALVARFAKLAELVPDATKRQMFGYPTCVLRGNMFMGLHERSMVLRLGEPDRTEFLTTYATKLFEPMPGRPMKEYVVVPENLLGDPAIEKWIEKSHDFALRLPEKQPKAKKEKK